MASAWLVGQSGTAIRVPHAPPLISVAIEAQAMLFVQVLSALSGHAFLVEMSSRATVFDLKRHLRTQHGVRKSMATVLFGSTPLGDADKLYDLGAVAPWFFIADVVDAETPRELTVSFVIKWPACGNCGQRAAKFCARCRAPYCSQACQRGDWQSHRRKCVELVGDP